MPEELRIGLLGAAAIAPTALIAPGRDVRIDDLLPNTTSWGRVRAQRQLIDNS